MIRPALRGDESGVVRVVKAVYDEYGFTWDPDVYHADLYDLSIHFGGPEAILFVAEDETRVLGCAGLETFTTVEGPHGEVVDGDSLRRIAGTDCEFLRLYVHAEARNRGIGAALIERVIGEARNRGRRHMEIWTDKRFVGAHRLYARYGARVVGDRICDDPDVSPEWGMILDL